VLRGGSWNNNQDNARSAIRNRNNPNNRNNNNGFRVVRRLTSQVRPFEEAADAVLQPGGYPTKDNRFQFMSIGHGLWNAVIEGDEMAQVGPVCAQPEDGKYFRNAWHLQRR
jgi:hypothetical protein